MRMEELSNNTYIKNTDTVERYLLNLVQDYFKTSNVAATTSREYIINKAVERMKEEISFDNIGVLSITLPNGEKRTGSVNITLEDLGGEPLINPKLTAFNVNFGTEANTACRGDDPRLSDSRKPLAHSHNIEDIIGLSGTVSTLLAKISRAEDFLHNHKNKSILDMLVYTGDKTNIDLTLLETLEDKVKKIASDIEQEITKHKQQSDNEIAELNEVITQTKQEIKTISDNVTETNQQYLIEAKEYVDKKIEDLNTFVQGELDKMITINEFNTFKQLLNNCFTLAGKMEIPFDEIIDKVSGQSEYNISLPISDTILTELNNRNETLNNCQIEIIMGYPNGENIVYQPFPYIIITDYLFDGSFQATTNFIDKTIDFSIKLIHSTNIPTEIKECNVIYSVYSKSTLI